METPKEFHRFNRYYQRLEPFLGKTALKAYTTAILSFLTMSFFGYFAIKPTLSTIASLNKQISDARLVDQQLQNKINALSLAQTEYQKIQSDLPLIYNALPKIPDFPPFIKSLEKIATESGLQITNLNFKNIDLSAGASATQSSFLIPIDFNLNLQGDYSQIDSFLSKIAGLERLVVIDKMGFNQKDSLEVVLSGQIFYAK